jgi:WD40 repeat protein
MKNTARVLCIITALALAPIVHAEGEKPVPGLLATLAPEANESHLYSVAFAPDGKTLATVLDKKVHIWDATTWKELRHFTMKDAEGRFAFSPDGKTFAYTGSAQGAAVVLYDAENGEPVRSFDMKPEWGDVTMIAFSKDGKKLVGCGKASGNPHLWIWDPATGAHASVKGPEVSDTFYTCAVAPDGNTVAAALLGSADILIIDLASGKEQKRVSNGDHFAKRVAFSPDGKNLGSCGFDGTVRLYDVAAGKLLAKFEQTYAVCVAFTPDGKYLVSSDREQFCFWDVAARKSAGVFGRAGSLKEVHNSQSVANGPEGGLAFSPDGKRVAWGCEYEEWAHVRVWDTAALIASAK